MSDKISISRIKVPVTIGVPDEERAFPQVIEISVEIYPSVSLFGTGDEIENTINYYDLSQDIVKEAQRSPRKLIEVLNEDILKMLLNTYPLKRATVTTYKYILEHTEHVALTMSLSRERFH